MSHNIAVKAHAQSIEEIKTAVATGAITTDTALDALSELFLNNLEQAHQSAIQAIPARPAPPATPQGTTKLERLIASAIPAIAAQNSVHLGDRTKYMGASDICGCPRKAVFGKLYPVKHSHTQHLIFSRGHIAQAMYAEYIKSSPHFEVQEEVEFVLPENPQILCHVDMLLLVKDKDGKVIKMHVLEVKSTSGVPFLPYSSWQDQLSLQLGLVKANTDPSISLSGSILAVDMNTGDFKEYPGYVPNDEVTNFLVAKGEKMLLALDGKVAPDCEPGNLCGSYCPYNNDCPAFGNKAAPLPTTLANTAIRLEDLLSGIKDMGKEVDALKAQLLEFTGTEASASYRTDDIIVKLVVTKDSEIIDKDKLVSEYPEIYEACKKTKKGYASIQVSKLAPPINKTTPAAASPIKAKTTRKGKSQNQSDQDLPLAA